MPGKSTITTMFMDISREAVMTQKTFRITRRLLMALSAILSIALVAFLEGGA